MTKLTDSSDDLLELLEAERDLEAAPPATRERLLARLGPMLLPPGRGGDSGGGGGGATDGAPTGGMSGAGGAGGGVSGGAHAASHVLRGKLWIAAISAAIGAGGGAATHAVLTPKPVPVAVTPAPSASSPVASSPVPSAETAAPAVSSSPTVVDPAPAPRTAASLGSSAHPAAPSMRMERLLLEAATVALERRDYTSALASLRKHATTYPKGELAQEREVLMVQTLEASGDHAGAVRRAKEFKQKFPGSLQQGTVDKAVRSE